jgi:hypothetical protein
MRMAVIAAKAIGCESRREWPTEAVGATIVGQAEVSDIMLL